MEHDFRRILSLGGGPVIESVVAVSTARRRDAVAARMVPVVVVLGSQAENRDERVAAKVGDEGAVLLGRLAAVRGKREGVLELLAVLVQEDRAERRLPVDVPEELRDGEAVAREHRLDGLDDLLVR